MIQIRVSAKTAADELRHISVAEDGSSFTCDCGGFDGVICSHIDAVLVAGERAMVHPDDRATADRAMALVDGRITVPETWKGTWRKNPGWRGLSGRGRIYSGHEPSTRDASKPLVCFTGKFPDGNREEMLAEARALGWETVDSPSRYTDVLVAGKTPATSAKLKSARQFNTPVVTLEEWRDLIRDGALPPA